MEEEKEGHTAKEHGALWHGEQLGFLELGEHRRLYRKHQGNPRQKAVTGTGRASLE